MNCEARTKLNGVCVGSWPLQMSLQLHGIKLETGVEVDPR